MGRQFPQSAQYSRMLSIARDLGEEALEAHYSNSFRKTPEGIRRGLRAQTHPNLPQTMQEGVVLTSYDLIRRPKARIRLSGVTLKPEKSHIMRHGIRNLTHRTPILGSPGEDTMQPEPVTTTK